MPNTPHRTQTCALLLTPLLLLVALASTACSNDLEVTELPLDIEANNDDNNDPNNDNNDRPDAEDDVQEEDDTQEDDADLPECSNAADCTASGLPQTTIDCIDNVCVTACQNDFVDANGDLDQEGGDGCECQPSNDSIEICDGIDNNCNGAVDDYEPNNPSVCTGVCQGGSAVCDGTTEVCNFAEIDAEGFIGPNGVEFDADGLDNNCDGRVDDMTCSSERARIILPATADHHQIQTAIAISRPPQGAPEDQVVAVAWVDTISGNRLISDIDGPTLNIGFFNLMDHTQIGATQEVAGPTSRRQRDLRLAWDGAGFSLLWIADLTETGQEGLFMQRYSIQGAPLDTEPNAEVTYKTFETARVIQSPSLAPLAQDDALNGRSLVGWLSPCEPQVLQTCTRAQFSDEPLGLINPSLNQGADKFVLATSGNRALFIWSLPFGNNGDMEWFITELNSPAEASENIQTINRPDLASSTAPLMASATDTHFVIAFGSLCGNDGSCIKLGHIPFEGGPPSTTHTLPGLGPDFDDLDLIGLSDRMIFAFQPIGTQLKLFSSTDRQTENPAAVDLFAFERAETTMSAQSLALTRGPGQSWGLSNSILTTPDTHARVHHMLLGRTEPLCLECASEVVGDCPSPIDN